MLLLVAALVILFFSLPRVVVDNNEGGMSPEASTTDLDQGTNQDFLHNLDISETDLGEVASLKASIRNEESQEKTTI